MKCLKPKNTDLLVVDIFVHVIILLGILLSFFVLVISKLETKELTGQITNQIEMLNKTEEDLRKEWADTQGEEQTAISDLQEKYGKVNINLDSGEINDS